MRMRAVIVALLLSLTEAFRVSRMPTSFVLRANRMDGLTISGDLVPLQNNLLIKVKEAAASTQGGIYIPDNAKERPTEGVCVAAGPGRIHPDTALQLECAIKAGECVIYGKYDGTELKYNDVNHQMIKDDDVLLKFSGGEPTLAAVECVKDQVMIRLPPKEAANLSGIIIATPESKEKRPDTGVVVKIGPGRQAGNGQLMKIQVAPGDGVRFRDFAGADVKIEGVEYRVIRAYDILAKWAV